MARFSGYLGYGFSEETAEGSGVWADRVVEKAARGDIQKNTRTLVGSDGLNDNIVVANTISVVADSYAIANYLNIKYLKQDGNLWIVTTVEIRRPRLLLTLGGVYNGPTP